MKRTLELQDRRLKAKEELRAKNLVLKSRPLPIDEVKEKEAKQSRNDVLIEQIAQQKKALDEQRLAYKKNYDAIQKQRDAYSNAMNKANEVRRGGSIRYQNED